MKLLNSILLACTLVAATILLCCASLVALRLLTTLTIIEAAPVFLSSEIGKQAEVTRIMAGVQIGKILDEARFARIDLVNEIKSGRGDVVQISEEYRRTLDAQLQLVNNTLAKETGELNISLRNVTAPAATFLATNNRISAQLESAAPLYLDCDHNPDCAFNRFQGTSKSLEKSAQAIAAAMPQLTASSIQIADNASAITGDVRTITHEVTKPEKWYMRVLKLVAPVGWAVRAVK
jgi:hypothetical protein